MGYFERLWSELPDAAPEHFAIRREFVIGALEPGSRVIDVGCGAGWFCGALAAAGFSVTGVEVAHEPLRRARERFPELDFVLVSGGGELPLAAASFDGAWLGEVLEHVQDGLGLLWEVARVVGPGGRLAVSTPDHGWGLRLRLGISRRAFEAHFEPRSDHVRFFTRRSLAALLAAGGFEQIQIRRRRGVLLVSARAAR
jgi:2-polyprenyl-3-methyl-5-hydroxy-6-metoxy-1,4-benzoquinol methylase